MGRDPRLAKFWQLVHRHPGGESAGRDCIAAVHDADGTCRELKGTDAYSSTKTLTDAQWKKVLEQLHAHAKPRRRRRRSPHGDVAYFVSPQQQAYISRLATLLGWSDEAFDAFILRQIKKPSATTHEEVDKIITPLERICRARGMDCISMKNGVEKLWYWPDEPKPGRRKRPTKKSFEALVLRVAGSHGLPTDLAGEFATAAHRLRLTFDDDLQRVAALLTEQAAQLGVDIDLARELAANLAQALPELA